MCVLSRRTVLTLLMKLEATNGPHESVGRLDRERICDTMASIVRLVVQTAPEGLTTLPARSEVGVAHSAGESTVRKTVLYGLGVVGILCLLLGLWWLLGYFAEEGYGPSFVLSIGIFLVVFAAISLRWMHETAAALLGVVAIWLAHYVGGAFFPALHMLDFEKSMLFVDWNVIFLILGMMIFMAMFSETGIFNWMAFRVFRLARGNAWLLGMFLVLLSGLVSAFLNNVTAILLFVPLSIQIAQTVGIHPFAYVIPEVLAANIGGAATIIGDPPSTVVGSHLGLSFVEYMVNMAPIAILCMVPLLVLTTLLYRREFAGARERLSPALVARLEADAHVTDRTLLVRTSVIGLGTLGLFLAGDLFGMPPSVIALTGAVILIAWVQPDMQRMLREVDWTTLFFFIGIFIVVGGLEDSGVISWIAGIIGDLAGDSLTLGTILMLWIPGLASGIVDNIPFTVATLPIADYLTATIPGAENGILYWALILGADLGGNATYLGSAPNIVAVGLLAQAGYRPSFGRFMRDGATVTVVTLVMATLWLLVRY
jgi:Na+/H+ antiporter NhaD/arsenite permease-like protein